MNIRILRFRRVRHTYGILYVNFRTLEIRTIYVQFSMKDMWKRPQCKIEGRSRLYGWLFIYFGSTIESIICPIVERDLSRVNSNIIKDRKGNNYIVVSNDIEMVKRHDEYIKSHNNIKGHYNRISNSVLYYDE